MIFTLRTLAVGLLLIASGNAYSINKLTVSEVSSINELNQYLYENLVKENSIKFNRLTSKGNLVGCELEFQKTYRDGRGLMNGVMPTVFSVGSFTINYFSDNHTMVGSLKIIPSIMDITKKEWMKLYPAYTGIFINEEGLEKYKLGEHQCENGGKCSAYGDKNGGADLLALIFKNPPFDGEIKLSLIKDGMDTGFKLSSLTTNENWEKESDNFYKCNLELMDIVMTELNKLSVEDKKSKK